MVTLNIFSSDQQLSKPVILLKVILCFRQWWLFNNTHDALLLQFLIWVNQRVVENNKRIMYLTINTGMSSIQPQKKGPKGLINLLQQYLLYYVKKSFLLFVFVPELSSLVVFQLRMSQRRFVFAC